MNPENIKNTVLLVDDHPANVNVLVDALNAEGLSVAIAISGEEALELIEKVTPDLILLDVRMPGIDGFETCRRLKEHDSTREIPVIFMTALTDTVNKVKGFEVGGVDYITKPFQYEEVLSRVNAHLTIRTLQRELQKEIAAKDQFFSIIAHDLRGPLSVLRDMIRFSAEESNNYSQKKLEHTFDLLQNSIGNLHQLMENLLTWSRLDRGLIEYAPRHVPLQKVIERNMALLMPMADQKQISLHSSIEEPISMYGDTNMVDTVVRNLLSNALKFTHSGGLVDVAATQDETMVEISVSDSGIGIDQKHIPKLFRIDVKFKQLGTAREKGTGLGLLLCKEFVEKHGGKLWIESEVGKGTTCRFTLPKAPGTKAPLTP